MSEARDLERFVEAQAGVYFRALSEIGSGRKRSHWMWYIFPQLAGLGRSAMAQRYAIGDAEEARAFLTHPILGPRYIACVSALQNLVGNDPVAVFGDVDALKLRSSLTLFEAAGFEAAGAHPLFAAALDRWFGGERDDRTIARLGLSGSNEALI